MTERDKGGGRKPVVVVGVGALKEEAGAQRKTRLGLRGPIC